MLRQSMMVLAATLAASTVPAYADDFSFTGTLPTPGTVQFFDFTVGSTSTVTLRTWSYAGGVNAAGQTIAQGGFDPILALFDLSTGLNINQNDDGGCGFVAADAVTGECYDTYLSSTLDAGTYRVAVMVYPNFAGASLSDPFDGADTFTDVTGDPRTNAWAFDILNVNAAVQNGVPEPAAWGMMIGGFGLAGAAMRRRRSVQVTYA